MPSDCCPDETHTEACPLERQAWALFNARDFFGNGTKSIFCGRKCERKLPVAQKKRERIENCEGEDVAGKEKEVCVQYMERKRAAGVVCINKPAQIRRK